MNKSKSELYPILGQTGPFAEYIKNFNPRPVQQQLASAIEDAIKSRNSLVAEAGTGIGKTFAYLIPLLLAESKAIVSTATKNLQDQLFNKDIPIVCEALGLSPRIALLKGRGNYLCIYRMQHSLEEGRLSSKQASHDLQMVWRWSSATKSGDLAELYQLADDSDIRSNVTSTADNCISVDCPNYDDCWVLKARTKAQKADILVINHHLLCADLVIKEDGFGELLPEVENVVVDEAHRLPDIVSLFFGKSFSSRQVLELAADLRKEYITESKDLSQLEEWATELESQGKDTREAFDDDFNRGSWHELRGNTKLEAELDELADLLKEVTDNLEPISEHTKGLESCYQRAERLNSLITQIRKQQDGSTVHWFELYPKSFVIHQTPIEINTIFKEQWQAQGGSWVFTSATLSVADQLDHFRSLMGLEDAAELNLPSPFKYKQQALLYLPRDMPEPSFEQHTEQLMAKVLPLIRANGGRTFCLFTSYRAMHKAAEWLSINGQFTLLVQGTAEKSALLERFTKESKTVLLATSSFWEGVDVRGNALSCVVIDKLPFAVPSDPVLKARLDAVKRKGRNAFNEVQLPNAVLGLKQGAGRLIRDHADQGVLVIGDNRLISKDYGRHFLHSLPDMHRTRDEQFVLDFFEGID